MKATMTITEFKALVKDVTYFLDLDITKLTLEDIPTLQDILYDEQGVYHTADYEFTVDQKERKEELINRAGRRR